MPPPDLARCGLPTGVDKHPRRGGAQEIPGNQSSTPDTGNGWSNANIELLRALAAEGHFAREIATQIVNSRGTKMSKAAIIGKARRVGIPLLRPSNGPKSHANASAKAPATAAKPAMTMRDVLANAQPLPPDPRVSLIDLPYNGCKFPLGDPREPDFGYCGQARKAGKDRQYPYCQVHHELTHGAGTPSEKAAHRVGGMAS